MMLPGCATPEGTARFRDRFARDVAADHFAEHAGLWLSSIGLGTYLGEATSPLDGEYRRAVERFLVRGGNVLDTAINYRFQRSERAIGAALDALVRAGTLARDEVLVATKGGFIPFDGEPPEDPGDWFVREYVTPGIVEPDEVAAGCHCMSPRYLEDQIERSRRNLGLETIDVYYVHNPEMQREEVGPERFRKRLLEAFAALERAADSGKIRAYGTATWDGYRCPPGAAEHLELEEIAAIAREAGGAGHRFRYVQLPLNLALPEAFLVETQTAGGQRATLLEVAARHGLTILASASILQGKLARALNPRVAAALSGLATHAQRAIQFTRSVPGVAAALVGMSRVDHVEENLAAARIPRTPPLTLRSLYEA